jgi:hypothetical protein
VKWSAAVVAVVLLQDVTNMGRVSEDDEWMPTWYSEAHDIPERSGLCQYGQWIPG